MVASVVVQTWSSNLGNGLHGYECAGDAGTSVFSDDDKRKRQGGNPTLFILASPRSSCVQSTWIHPSRLIRSAPMSMARY